MAWGLLIHGACPAPDLPAQGTVKLERWTYAALDELRRTIADACRGADAATLAAVARDLAAPIEGNPFGPPLSALARLRKVEPDAAFLYRGNLRAIATPEVVDPDGALEICRDLNVTFYLHYPVADPVADPVGEGGAVHLQLTVRDQAGDTVWEHTVEDKTALQDLLRHRPMCQVPGAVLEDGSYTLTAAAVLDGIGPRAGDPVTVASFAVLRGYQERAEALLFTDLPAITADRSVPLLSRAAVTGAVTPVARAFGGEPPVGRGHPRVDLQNAERVVANVKRGAAPLAGLTGRVDLGLPTGDGDEIALVTLRLPDAGEAPRPLVVFLPGGPAFDHESRRPTSPPMTGPGWWADLLSDRGFGIADGERRWNWAVMESPGRVSRTVPALQAVVAGLTELLDVPAGQVCLVGERQGAWVIGHSLHTFDPAALAGVVVMVSGGNLPLDKLGDIPALGIPARGHSSSPALQRLAQQDSPRLQMLDAANRPWPIVLSVSLPEIESFLERLWR